MWDILGMLHDRRAERVDDRSPVVGAVDPPLHARFKLVEVALPEKLGIPIVKALLALGAHWVGDHHYRLGLQEPAQREDQYCAGGGTRWPNVTSNAPVSEV